MENNWGPVQSCFLFCELKITEFVFSKKKVYLAYVIVLSGRHRQTCVRRNSTQRGQDHKCSVFSSLLWIRSPWRAICWGALSRCQEAWAQSSCPGAGRQTLDLLGLSWVLWVCDGKGHVGHSARERAAELPWELLQDHDSHSGHDGARKWVIFTPEVSYFSYVNAILFHKWKHPSILKTTSVALNECLPCLDDGFLLLEIRLHMVLFGNFWNGWTQQSSNMFAYYFLKV